MKPPLSAVKDSNGNITGIWFANPDRSTFETPAITMFMMGEGISQDQFVALMMGDCRVIPNKSNSFGGAFFMFGDALAPGERPAIQRRVTSAEWFKDTANRGGPHAPSDFNLFEMPKQSLQEWASGVSAAPLQVQCTEVRISELGSVTQTLFDVLKQERQLDSSGAVELFDEYLGAACPKCFGGITGSMLGMIAASSRASSVSVLGGGAGFQRILSGRCGTCDSDTYRIVWHGDKSLPLSKHSSERLSPKEITPPNTTSLTKPKKWWEFWK